VKLRVVSVGLGLDAGGCLLSWAAGGTRAAAVVGGTLTSTAADDGRPAERLRQPPADQPVSVPAVA
jgi:hypothetical protein